MSTAARKARKDRGEPIVRAQKVGTPLFRRLSFLRAGAYQREVMAGDRGMTIPAQNTFKVKARA